ISSTGRFLNSPIISQFITLTEALLPDPVIEPPSTNFSTLLELRFSVPGYENDDRIKLYYTTDGLTPTVKKSSLYKKPFFIRESTFISLFAVRDSVKQSRVVAEYYVKGEKPVVQKVTIIPRGGTYAGAIPPIALHCPTERAIITYTIDGSEPTMASKLWDRRPVMLTKPSILKSKAFLGENIPSVTTAERFDFEKLPSPVPSRNSGTIFSDSLVLYLRSPDFLTEESMVIFYTIDGNDPALFGIVASDSIVLYRTSTVKALLRKKGYYDSEVVTWEYFCVNKVVYAYFQDRNSDGLIDGAVLHFGKKLSEVPTLVEFTNPLTGDKMVVKVVVPENTTFMDSSTIDISLTTPFSREQGFTYGHYGRIPLPGQFDTEPFLMFERSKNVAPTTVSLAQDSLRKDEISIINDPFSPQQSLLPGFVQALDDFQTEKGTVVIVRPYRPSTASAEITDSLGRNVVFTRQFREDERTGLLYFVWDGKDENNQYVRNGTFTIAITIEEKITSKVSQRYAYIQVNSDFPDSKSGFSGFKPDTFRK
ncbi:MAG: chitobiase/beta-hexosaminidase C-terminal domain-containing protein, partial [Chitinivibrionales bacterium]|nr:chitobiase/beta-hexosaminidase C-terminal domain-containing protein [Chitinivibrionales bacterium]